MQHLIYLINWRASKLQMGPRQTAHWYPLDHAQGSNTGNAKWHVEASATPCLASACGNPKGYHRNSHKYPPMEEVSDHRNVTAATAPRESCWPGYPPEVRPGR